jgi:hypothetical protein
MSVATSVFSVFSNWVSSVANAVWLKPSEITNTATKVMKSFLKVYITISLGHQNVTILEIP